MKASVPKSNRPLSKGKQIGLRSKPSRELAMDRLPFVGNDHGRHSSWDVPMSGGLHGGSDAGKSVAQLFLKYVRDEQSNPSQLSSTLLESMFIGLASKQPETLEEVDSVKGQRFGFISELARWLVAAAVQLGAPLDRISEQQLVEMANHHLTRTDASLVAAIKAMEAS